ncbi:MAG: class I tRNA ligase family protein [bacterium]|nr:class I tRNA ligase family protein [bacterium]
MQETFNHKEIEKNATLMWEKSNAFSPKRERGKKPFSLFLNPPNASGPMHIGNALMIAIQDILARYHRAFGEPTLWVPSVDHGGYETQVTFEKELEKAGKTKSDYSKKEFSEGIHQFVEKNKSIIENQVKALGASVDWSRFRFALDDASQLATNEMFGKMVDDNLIYRRLYMVNYCPSCATFLAEIELKEIQEKTPLYFIKFDIKDSQETVTLATTRPEFLFTVTHVLAHPADARYAHYIGKTLLNPITNQPVEIIASKRKFDPQKAEPFLSPFFPSFKSYDYQYALRSPDAIPSFDIIDWSGNMIDRYPGLKPKEAREKELSLLKKDGRIEKVDDSYQETVSLCKSEHKTENKMMFTWFLRLDDEKSPLRKPAIEAIEKEKLVFSPHWRKKGLVEWMGKMNDWPIARQSVLGIKIPIWYDVSNPEKFVVWFVGRKGEKCYGPLKHFLDQSISLDEILHGLERVYALEGAPWVLEKEPGKPYLPETDTFDTWFSSGQWASIVFGHIGSADFSYFYPSDSIVTGHDLLRLSVSKEIMLSFYLTKKLPYKLVYIHPLLQGKDGQKMSKSLGNMTSLEYYLEKFGADATRMALVSYTASQEDFYFSEERLALFQDFSSRLWHIGQIVDLVNEYKLGPHKANLLSEEDKKILQETDDLIGAISFSIKKYMFAAGQEKACNFLSHLEEYAASIQSGKDIQNSMSLLREVYEKYLIVLHPFMPFMTEELYKSIYKKSPLAAVRWPRSAGFKLKSS